MSPQLDTGAWVMPLVWCSRVVLAGAECRPDVVGRLRARACRRRRATSVPDLTPPRAVSDRTREIGRGTVGLGSGAGPGGCRARRRVRGRPRCLRRRWGPDRRPGQGAEPRAGLRAGRGRGRCVHRPAAVLTNDEYPRAIRPDGSRVEPPHWQPVGVTLRRGCSSAHARSASRRVVVGAGRWWPRAPSSSHDVPDFALVAGTPARRIGWVGPRRATARSTRAAGAGAARSPARCSSSPRGTCARLEDT